MACHEAWAGQASVSLAQMTELTKVQLSSQGVCSSDEWGMGNRDKPSDTCEINFPFSTGNDHTPTSAAVHWKTCTLGTAQAGVNRRLREHTPAEDGLEDSRAPPSPPRPTTLLFTEPTGSTREKDQTLLPTGQCTPCSSCSVWAVPAGNDSHPSAAGQGEDGPTVHSNTVFTCSTKTSEKPELPL